MPKQQDAKNIMKSRIPNDGMDDPSNHFSEEGSQESKEANDTFICKVYNSITSWIQYLFPRVVVRVILVYLVWITIHYVASHLYISLCTPLSLRGFIMSAILVPAPHCQGLRWVVFNGAVKIEGMWVLLGGYILHFIEKSFTV